jgi:NAD(P)-dependent dehydrogenase (short-subunit alcohol dehydrogenase family)
VVLLYKTTSDAEANAFVKSLPGQGHIALSCNIADDKALVAALDGVDEVDVIVHTAVDPIVRKKISRTSPAEFRAQFEAGVFGGFNLLSLLAPRMKEGIIIGITTDALEETGSGGTMPGYISAKYALKGLLHETAKEFTNVRVIALAPGLMQTKLTMDLPPRLFEWMQGSLTTPAHIAEKIAFLLSPEGQTLRSVSIRLPDEKTSTL